jgi:hypothetical protein
MDAAYNQLHFFALSSYTQTLFCHECIAPSMSDHTDEHTHEHTHKHEHTKTELSSESVKILLKHWIEHNESHSASFRDRATQVAKVNEAAARDIEQAAVLMDQCTEMLKKAMKDL